MPSVPDPANSEAFERWLSDNSRVWSVVVSARTALRVMPLIRWQKIEREAASEIVLPVFQAVAISRFAAIFPDKPIGREAPFAGFSAAVDSSDAALRAGAAIAASVAATSAAAARTSGRGESHRAGVAAAAAVTAAIRANDKVTDLVRHDAEALALHKTAPGALARMPLRLGSPLVMDSWRALSRDLRSLGERWDIWIDWYESVLVGSPPLPHRPEAWEISFTDLLEILPWNNGALAVNTEIAKRLEIVGNLHDPPAIPDQSPAPVRVEERDGKVAKLADHDAPLRASERDFAAWRDAILAHLDELLSGDFRDGTNHKQARDRLLALRSLLHGDISDVKERQFRIGYEVERFEGVLTAYRSAGDDMPVLNVAQMEDIERLHAALRIAADKLERWSEFREVAVAAPGVDPASAQIVSRNLDEMASVMEGKPDYFHPEMPETFRFLAEATRDPWSATKTVIYGAVKSAENLVSFLGQRALGIGKKGADAVENHISKAVATALVASLSAAALEMSGTLPHVWAWLKPLLAALRLGG